MTDPPYARPDLCPTCHSPGLGLNGCQNMWHIEVRDDAPPAPTEPEPEERRTCDARCRDVEAERDELRYLFDLQWTRMVAATALWRQESPAERANVMPDLGRLLEWLIADRDKLAGTLSAMRSATHIADGEDLTDWQRGYRACSVKVLAASRR